MLKLKEQPAPTFKTPVEIPVPGGKAEKIRVEYKYMTQKEYEAFVAADPERTVRDTLLELIVTWDGVDMAFGADALDTLADALPGAPVLLLQAYQQERWGARAKN